MDYLPAGLTPLGAAKNLGVQLKFRLETFGAQGGYLGAAGAADAHFVGRIFKALTDAWENDDKGYIDSF